MLTGKEAGHGLSVSLSPNAPTGKTGQAQSKE